MKLYVYNTVSGEIIDVIDDTAARFSGLNPDLSLLTATEVKGAVNISELRDTTDVIPGERLAEQLDTSTNRETAQILKKVIKNGRL